MKARNITALTLVLIFTLTGILLEDMGFYAAPKEIPDGERIAARDISEIYEEYCSGFLAYATENSTLVKM